MHDDIHEENSCILHSSHFLKLAFFGENLLELYGEITPRHTIARK